MDSLAEPIAVAWVGIKIKLTSHREMLVRFGLSRTETFVDIPVTLLVGRKYRQGLYLAAPTRRNDRPTSRRVREQVGGVSRWTQRRAEQETATTVTRNYVRMPDASRDAPGVFVRQCDGSILAEISCSTVIPTDTARFVRRRSSAPDDSTGAYKRPRRQRRYHSNREAAKRSARMFDRGDHVWQQAEGDLAGGVRLLASGSDQARVIENGWATRYWSEC